MKKYVSIMAVLLLFGLTMWAQAGTSNQNSNSGSTSMSEQNSGNSSYGQSSSSGMNQSSSSSKSVEGCIVRQETDYYIVPEQGSAKKLTDNTGEVGQHVGHHVKVTGAETSSSAATSGGTSGSNAENEGFIVAEVNMVSANCPANWNPSEMQKYQSNSNEPGK
jgi:hypothetical protein